MDIFGSYGPVATRFLEELTEHSRSLGLNDTRSQAGWSAAHWQEVGQRPDVEQVRRARTERFARAHPSPESRRRQPQQQARPVSVSLSRPDYGRMSTRELNRLAYRRFGPGYREECESRGSRRRALIDLLESCH